MEPLLKIWLPLARWSRRWLKVIDARELLYGNITGRVAGSKSLISLMGRE